jgi:hypothetical protein
MLSLFIDHRNQMWRRHFVFVRDFFERVSERILKANASDSTANIN